MSVQSETSRVQYSGNGSTATAYQIPFLFYDAEEIAVVITDSNGGEILLAAESYTVSGAGDANGGTLTTTTAYDNTHKVTIYRDVPEIQQTTYAENDAFPAATTEKSLDRLTMMVQQLRRGLSRCVRTSEASAETAPILLSSLGSEAVLTINSEGVLSAITVAALAEKLNVVAAIPEMVTAMAVMYPIGALFFTTRSKNPSEILGFGTWQRYGAGRFLVSVDPDSTAYASAGALGGADTVTLSTSQIPAHIHGVLSQTVTSASNGAHVHSCSPGSTSENTHNHTYTTYSSLDAVDNNESTADMWSGAPATVSTSSDTHSHTIPSFSTASAGAHTHSVTIPAQDTVTMGGGGAHENRPRYIAVNMWVRVESATTEVETYTPEAAANLLAPSETGDYVMRSTDGTVYWSTYKPLPTVPTTGDYVARATNGTTSWSELEPCE